MLHADLIISGGFTIERSKRLKPGPLPLWRRPTASRRQIALLASIPPAAGSLPCSRIVKHRSGSRLILSSRPRSRRRKRPLTLAKIAEMNLVRTPRVVAAGIVGNVLEWYDFAIYGYFAATIGRQFFPHEDAVAQLLSAFGIFALGYL